MLEEQAPVLRPVSHDSPWSFLIRSFFAMHGDAGARFEQFTPAILVDITFDIDFAYALVMQSSTSDF